MLLTLVVFAAIVELRPILPGQVIHSADSFRIPAVYVAVLLLWIPLFGMAGVYNLAAIPSFSNQFGRFTGSYLLAVFVLGGLLYFTYRDMSRMLVLCFSAANYFVLLLTRYALTRYLRTAFKDVKRTNVLVAGTGRSAVDLAQVMMLNHGAIYHVVGFADDDWEYPTPLPAPLIGQLDEVPALVDNHDVQLVLIALPEHRSRQIEKLIKDLGPHPVRVYLVYDLGKIALLRSEVESFGNSLVVGVREPVIQGAPRLVKRIFDLTVSIILFVLTLPLLAMIWVAIKLDSPGPAVYRAERVGENGKLFQMLKFRSMVADADKLRDQSMSTDKEGRPIYKLDRDPRVTRVGRFLRRTSLDELPQLVNVIRGEMSLVGPRPEQPFIVENYDSLERERLAVPPGVTGWWQVSGRSDLPLHLNVHLDLYYVRNYSLFLDLKILFKTVGVIVKGKGAY
jgi:exopolysaccharide biosynthesis polyprenyl glycosylphosphotransferase